MLVADWVGDGEKISKKDLDEDLSRILAVAGVSVVDLRVGMRRQRDLMMARRSDRRQSRGRWWNFRRGRPRDVENSRNVRRCRGGSVGRRRRRWSLDSVGDGDGGGDDDGL